RTEGRSPLIKKLVQLADLKDLSFGGWDIFKDNAYQAAAKAGVLNPEHLGQVKTFLSGIQPMKAAFDHEYVKRLEGTHVKKAKNKDDLARQLKAESANFKKQKRVSRLVMGCCRSTEVCIRPEEWVSMTENFDAAMKN